MLGDWWYNYSCTLQRKLPAQIIIIIMYICIGSSNASSVDVWVTVRYIDYGNEEQLSLDRLKILEESFCDLPCQSVSCYLVSIDPFDHLEKEVHWQESMNIWIEMLLLGRAVDICVLTSNECGQYGIDIMVEKEALMGSEYFARYLPLPAECSVQLLGVETQESVVKLTSFLLSTCIPKMVQSCDLEAVTANVQKVSKVPSTSSKEEISIHYNIEKNEARVNLKCFIEHVEADSKYIVPLYPRRYSQLLPLVVHLNGMSEFPVLVSYVVNAKEFYVHPIQEHIAHGILSLSQILNHHYSSQEKVNLFPVGSSSFLKDACGLCCIQSPDDEKWYRGVILSVCDSEGTCSIQLLDFGDTLFVPIQNLYKLEKQFFCYPPLAICCSVLSPGCKQSPIKYKRVCQSLMHSVGNTRLVVRVSGKSVNYNHTCMTE